MTLTREFEIADSLLAEDIIDSVFSVRDLAIPTDPHRLDWDELSKAERLAVAKAVFEKVLEKIEGGYYAL